MENKSRRHPVNKKICIGLALLSVLILITLFAPLLAKTDPNEADPMNTFIPPGHKHWMGTDNIGRDIWSRFCYGGRVSLLIGVVSMFIGTILGSVIGIIAGFYGSWIDSILTWFTEVLMAFPGMLLALTIMAILGPGLGNVMVAVGVGSIPQYMRMARSSVMKTREMDYVEAARCIGCRDSRILFRHILPNILRPIIVLATLGIGSAILEGAALSFLGLGAQPMTPEWGAMLSSGRQYLRNAWWISVFPGLGVFLVILSINFIGEGLGEILDRS
ncbi:MAG: ABC transporter permease [Anaerolineaceae bacterium]|nr:ABC transporter permease [Anaerolineaceae bacterium]